VVISVFDGGVELLIRGKIKADRILGDKGYLSNWLLIGQLSCVFTRDLLRALFKERDPIGEELA